MLLMIIHYMRSEVGRNLASDYGGALNDFDKAIDLCPDFLVAFYLRARCRLALESNEEAAIADLDFVIECPDVDFDWQDAYLYRGILKIRLKDYSGAISDFDLSIKLDPEYLRAYIERADAKFKSGLHQEAIADCSKALDNIDSFDKDDLGVLGARAYFLRGRIQTRIE